MDAQLADLKAKLDKLVFLTLEVRRLQDVYFNRGRRDFDMRAARAAESKLDELLKALRRQGYGAPPPTTTQSSLL